MHALPFRRLLPGEVRPFENSVPLYDLAVAAGGFSDEQQSAAVPLGSEDRAPGAFDWIELPDAFRPRRGLFVARVMGESMNRRIPNGAWCLFRLPTAGSRQDRVVVAQHRDIHDSETGGHYTVKVYSSRKRRSGDDAWEHEEILLKPDTTAEGFEPIVLTAGSADEVRIVAELVAVLPER
jgi:phage repressor protein C with HTH and peptisase S24 domain